MTKFKLVFLLALGLCFTACSSGKLDEPEKVGKHVFNMLQKMNTLSFEEYSNYFITLEELRALGENEEVVTSEETRNMLTSYEKQEYDENLKFSFEMLKEEAGNNLVLWEDIEYFDFTYEKKTEAGITGIEGKLTFQYNDTSYLVFVSAIWDGNEYKLTRSAVTS